MLTKTVKIDDDVAKIIKEMTWVDDGPPYIGKIEQQLERKEYEKVAKAIKLLGGKWNRSLNGHVFNEDPRAVIADMEGSLTVERDGFFETPSHIIEKMLSYVNVWGDVLEPSAGLGAIAKVVVKDPRVNSIIVVEKNPTRAKVLYDLGFETVCTDFLTYRDYEFDLILMNPPFENGQDIDHVLHAYRLLNHGGQLIAIMSEGPFFRGDRKSRSFRQWLDDVHANTEKLPMNSFAESGTGVNTRLVVIYKSM